MISCLIFPTQAGAINKHLELSDYLNYPTTITTSSNLTFPNAIMAPPETAMANGQAPSKIPDQEFDNLGDLTLIVGNDRIRFKVSSSAIRMSCPAWNAMLTGPYIESGLSEISLPEDSPSALLIILQIIHYKFNNIPKALTLQQMVELAQICDKYDLVSLVGPWLRAWTSPHRKRMVLKDWLMDNVDWFYVAWVFGYEADFKKLTDDMTSLIVQHKDGSQWFLGKTCVNKIMPYASLDIIGKSPWLSLVLGFTTSYNDADYFRRDSTGSNRAENV
jgi:hypothetical protein